MVFSNLKISIFTFEMEAVEKIILPDFKGSTFRGGFGHAFRKAVCTFKEHRDCMRCLLKDKCIYSYVFETITSEEKRFLQGSERMPHPFIIEAEQNEKEAYETGDTLKVNLILIGKAIEYLPYFVYSFKILANNGIGRGRGKYFLRKVISKDIEQRERIVFDGTEQMLTNKYYILNGDEIIQETQIANDSVLLKIITPLRIRYQRKLIDYIDFHVLARNLLRRLSLLMYRHCDSDFKINHKKLINDAKKVTVSNSELNWTDRERYSSRQQTRMKMGGVLGTIHYTGNVEPYLPFLKIGEYIHVGKGATFGMGKYEIVNEGGK